MLIIFRVCSIGNPGVRYPVPVRFCSDFAVVDGDVVCWRHSVDTLIRSQFTHRMAAKDANEIFHVEIWCRLVSSQGFEARGPQNLTTCTLIEESPRACMIARQVENRILYGPKS